MYYKNTVRRMRLIALAGVIAVTIGAFPLFAGPEGTLNCYGTEYYKNNSGVTQVNTYVNWWYNASDPLVEGYRAKILPLTGRTGSSSEYWVLLTSWYSPPTPAPNPELYYWNGSTWQFLADDEVGGGTTNFRTVVHFKPGISTAVTPIVAFVNRSVSYPTQPYGGAAVYMSIDPGYTGCYYLEVNPNGTLQKVYH